MRAVEFIILTLSHLDLPMFCNVLSLSKHEEIFISMDMAGRMVEGVLFYF